MRYMAVFGKISCSFSINPSTNPLISNDTNNRKAILTTKEKDNRRSLSRFSQPRLALTSRFQIELIESCISAKTVVAPMIRVTKPVVAATVLLPLIDAFLIIFWI